MFKLQTNEFELEFEPIVYEMDMEYPVNTILNVYVNSYGFSSTTIMEINIKDFSIFVKKLSEIYDTLSGKVRLEEPYGVSYLEFEAKTGGHIQVRGKLYGQRNGYSQELSFENKFDQTYLRGFVKELVVKYHHYLNS